MKKKNVLGCVLVCASIFLVGCNNDEEGTTLEPIEELPEVVEEELPYVTPFTGERVAEEVSMKPIIATINNHPNARPQSGLASADVVYEMLAEGDVTRFLALYQSEIPDNIGPIRSARSYFIELAKGLDAFYIAHGFSPEAQSMLRNNVVDNINGMYYDGSIFKRSRDRVAPHNSYISGENVKVAADKVGASLLYNKKVSYNFLEEDESAKAGLEANHINVNYNNNNRFNSSYQYNPESKTYIRESAGVKTIDLLTSNPIELSNILIFEMKHSVIDHEGRRDIDLVSGGAAYVFQEGTMRQVLWKNIDGVLKAVEVDDSEVKLVPGKTWVHFVPTHPGIETAVTYTQ